MKRRILGFLAAIMLALAVPAAAEETYGMGGGTNDEASVVVFGNANTGRSIAVFVRGTDGALWWNTGPDTGKGFDMANWHSLGGGIIGAPSCIGIGSDIECFARGLDNALWQINRNNGSWGGWTKVGGILTAPPSAVLLDDLNGKKTTQIYVQTTGGQLSYTEWQPNGWMPWFGLKTFMQFAPGCGMRDTLTYCAYQAPGDPALRVLRAMSGDPSQAAVIKGDTHFRPVLVSDPFTQAHVFVVVTGTDNHLWTRGWKKGIGWGGWKKLGATTQSAPACTWEANGGIWCTTRNANGATMLRHYQATELE